MLVQLICAACLAILWIHGFQFFDVGFCQCFYFVQIWDFAVAYKCYCGSFAAVSGCPSDSVEIHWSLDRNIKVDDMSYTFNI